MGVRDVMLRDKEPGAPVGCTSVHGNSRGRCEDSQTLFMHKLLTEKKIHVPN